MVMNLLRLLVILPPVALSVVAAGISQVTLSSTPTPTTTTSTSSSTVTPAVSPRKAVPFPPIGSIPECFTDECLERLWDLVGPVESPSITTTVEPKTPIVLPSPPPPLYPTWYAPEPTTILPNLKFPKGFKFGVATAAYQVEGAVKAEGKGPMAWDWGSRYPGAIADGSNADIADLQYYLYKEDTARVAALGVTDHSFSISWSRIFPFGTKGSPINQAGLNHYSDLINYSTSLGVNPVVTLFHFDVPLALLSYYGGFTSGRIVEDFVNYATTIFKAYNGRVNTWITFNEPKIYCGLLLQAYPFNSTLTPGVNSSTAYFQCSYNLLRAHAGAVKAFRAMNISGEIGFKNGDYICQPWRTNSTEDVEAAERCTQYTIGLYSEPVYGSGDWPELVKQTLPESFLPRFTEEEKRDLKGSADFYAIDAYTNMWASAPPNGLADCLRNPADVNWASCYITQNSDSSSGWPAGITADMGASWIMARPEGLRWLLKAIHQRWPSDKMYITEFGFSRPQEGQRTDLASILDDSDRTNYFMTYLGEALLSIHEDGIPLAGVFAWSMVDNMEWNSGLATRFGLQHVNYTTLERTYKRSAIALSQFFKAHLQ